MTSDKELQDLIIEGIRERKGHSITLIDMSKIDTAATGAFIIAEGNSTTHTGSIAEAVEEFVRVHGGIKPYAIDGEEGSDWVVMDYGSVWVHLFIAPTRNRYKLEDLWSDAVITNIPDLD